MSPPIHLTERRPEAPAPVIACGIVVSPRAVLRGLVTSDPAAAACYKCAVKATSLTEPQRNVVWDNANERRDRFRLSPWDRAKEKAKKAAERAKADAEKEVRKAARRARGVKC